MLQLSGEKMSKSIGNLVSVDEFLAEHIQWSHLDGYLKDRPSQPWTLFRAH